MINSKKHRKISKQRVVLLGSAGTGAAFAAACALRRVWSQSVKIVAMDINPQHLVTTGLLADSFERVPPSASQEFPGALLGILERHAVDTYLPLFPEEITLAARLREDGRIPATVVVMAPPIAASEACADKLMLNQLLRKYGVPVPKTVSACNPFAANEVFLKPKNGTGSRAAQKVKAVDLSSLVGSCASEWVVQEVCEKPEVTVDAFCDPAISFNHFVCRERIETKSGVSIKCRLFADETLSHYGRGIADALNLRGSFCYQAMRNAIGWVITDVNPRPGAGTAMCLTTGNDFFAASFALCWGENTKEYFRPQEGEQFVTRQYAEFLMGAKA